MAPEPQDSPELPLIAQFFNAAVSGDLAVLRNLVETGAVNPRQKWDDRADNTPDRRFSHLPDRTAFIVAARHGHRECVEFLLPFSDIEHADAFGNTALLVASRSGSLETIRFLVDSGADAGIVDPEGRGGLFWSVAVGHAEGVRFFLNQPACDPERVDQNGSDAFEVAITQKSWDCLSLLAPRASKEKAESLFRELITSDLAAQADFFSPFVSFGSLASLVSKNKETAMPKAKSRLEEAEIRAVVQEWKRTGPAADDAGKASREASRLADLSSAPRRAPRSL